jgi:hypothetical protein
MLGMSGGFLGEFGLGGSLLMEEEEEGRRAFLRGVAWCLVPRDVIVFGVMMG